MKKIILGLALLGTAAACTPEYKCGKGPAVKAAQSHQRILANTILTAERGYKIHTQRVSEPYSASCSFWNGYTNVYYSCTKHRTRVQETPVPIPDQELQRIRDSIPAMQDKQRRLHEQPNTPNTCLLYTSPSPRDS